MLNSFLTVKFHTNLLPNIVKTRDLCGKYYVKHRNKTGYQTNRLIKYVGCYYVLKALAVSGVIKNYRQQLPTIAEALNVCNTTANSLIKGCARNGYLKLDYWSGNITLSSYSTFSESFGIILNQFTAVKYNYSQHRITDVLETAYLQLMEQERERVLNSKIESDENLKSELKTLINPDKRGSWQPALKALQVETFKYGHAKQYSIFYLNADTGLNTASLRDRFNFKSAQSVSYLKSKLSKKELIKVSPQRVPSQVPVNKTNRINRLFMEFDHDTRQLVWVMPDRLEYAPILQK